MGISGERLDHLGPEQGLFLSILSLKLNQLFIMKLPISQYPHKAIYFTSAQLIKSKLCLKHLHDIRSV